MSKFKLFVENMLAYGVGGIINKIIPLIMVPIVIRLMPNSEYYGISDLSQTLVLFSTYIAVMGMYDAMYRMFFEKDDEEYKKSVCSTAFMFTIATSIIVFIAMLLLRNVIAQYFFGDKQYAYVVYLSAMSALVGGSNSIVQAPTRMQNKRIVYVVTNTLGSLISYSIAILLLLKGYYVIALPLSMVISSITLELFFWIVNHKWFSRKKFDKDLLKQLLSIALPLFPNFLIYWVFNSCDKLLITNMIGLSAAGIYSVASKLGHVSQLIYTAFAGGWQFFAFSTMKEKDQVKSNSLIFEYLGIVSYVATLFICAWSYDIFKLLFTDEYLSGYISAPYLFLAPLLQMLFQVASNQFLVIKRTWFNMFILSGGVVLNIIINFILIPILGIEGASIATLMGYVVSDIICVLVLVKMKLMVVSLKFIIATLIMCVSFVIWRMFFHAYVVFGMLLAIIATCGFLILYKSDLMKLKTTITNRG